MAGPFPTVPARAAVVLLCLRTCPRCPTPLLLQPEPANTCTPRPHQPSPTSHLPHPASYRSISLLSSAPARLALPARLPACQACLCLCFRSVTDTAAARQEQPANCWQVAQAPRLKKNSNDNLTNPEARVIKKSPLLPSFSLNQAHTTLGTCSTAMTRRLLQVMTRAS